MGTALHAIVELREDGDRWSVVSKWSLGKDYALMRVLHAQATDNWPRDVHYRDSPRYDFRRYWLNGDATVADVEEPSPDWQSLQASLPPLVSIGATRVLFYEI